MSQKKAIELYGFSGKIGSGKNHLAEKVFAGMLPAKSTLVMAFADQLKVDCCVKDQVDYNRVFVKKDEASRRLLQIRGTEEGRAKYGLDHWVRYMDTWVRLYTDRGIQRFIITDVRYPNELEWLKSRGGIAIRVEAPRRNWDELMREADGDTDKLTEIKGHSSETSLDNCLEQFDYILDNDYDRELAVVEQIQGIVAHLGFN